MHMPTVDTNRSVQKVSYIKQDDFVSVADIKVNQRLELVNFDVSVSAAFRSNDKKAKWINHFIILLPQLFSKPVNEKDMKVYLLCQYISEFIKILGYDGIKYMSSKSDCGGANYSIFLLINARRSRQDYIKFPQFIILLISMKFKNRTVKDKIFYC